MLAMKRENLRKYALVAIVVLSILSSVSYVFGYSDTDDWGNKYQVDVLSSKIKLKASGGKIGIKFPFVDSDILSVRLFRVHSMNVKYSYERNGNTYTKTSTWRTDSENGSNSKTYYVQLPSGATDVQIISGKAKFKINSQIAATGGWVLLVPHTLYVYI